MLEILKYTLPALIVLATAYIVLQAFLSREARNRKSELALANQKLVTPVRLQAYERLALFLERISPEMLLTNIQQTGLSAKQMRALLLHSIRSEYEHNLSQQLYVSNEAWAQVKSAKEGLIKLINLTEEQLAPDAPAIELSKALLEMLIEAEQNPMQVAIEALKHEASELFG